MYSAVDDIPCLRNGVSDSEGGSGEAVDYDKVGDWELITVVHAASLYQVCLYPLVVASLTLVD